MCFTWWRPDWLQKSPVAARSDDGCSTDSTVCNRILNMKTLFMFVLACEIAFYFLKSEGYNSYTVPLMWMQIPSNYSFVCHCFTSHPMCLSTEPTEWQTRLCPNTLWLHCTTRLYCTILFIVTQPHWGGNENTTMWMFSWDYMVIFKLEDVSNFMLVLVMVRGEIITDKGHSHN